jgi:flagellar protein FlbB
MAKDIRSGAIQGFAANRGKVPQKPAPKKRNLLAIIIFTLIFLVILIVGGIAAGVYLKVIDVPGIAEKFHLYDYPGLSQYLPKKANNFEPVELPVDGAQVQKTEAVEVASSPVPAIPKAATVEETEKLIKIAKLEEAKRISKLARLYGGMKPDEAIPILNQLDDATVLSILGKMEDEQVSKIMSQFDPKRAARLTQDMLKGKTTPSPL